MPEEWLTTQDVAELSGYHPDHIRRLIRAREIEARKFGPVWQVSRQSLNEYLDPARKLHGQPGDHQCIWQRYPGSGRSRYRLFSGTISAAHSQAVSLFANMIQC